MNYLPKSCGVKMSTETVSKENKSKTNAQVIKKGLSVFLDVLTFAAVFFSLFVLCCSISLKTSGNESVSMFGYELRLVESDSMEECPEFDASQYEVKSIPLKSCVFIETIPEKKDEKDAWYRDLKVGDVLTFRYVYGKQTTITHRLIEKEEIDGGYRLSLQGDNRHTGVVPGVQIIDTTLQNSPNAVIGKVKGQSYPLGLAVSIFHNRIGIIFVVIVPCFIIIAFEVYRIILVASEMKKEEAKGVSPTKEIEKEAVVAEASFKQSEQANQQPEKTANELEVLDGKRKRDK